MARKPTRAKQLGITDADYDRLLAAQGGHCALCPATPKTRRLHVDHDHATGKVRGLLCHRCNRTLPTWISPAWLRRAAAYLSGDTPLARRRRLPDDLVTKPLLTIGGQDGQRRVYDEAPKMRR